MSDIVLHGFPVSSNTHRVRLMLSLLGVPFEERMVNLVTGEHLKPEFTTLNPQQKVPALIHDGRVLTESYAILLYLAQTFGGDQASAWWPSDPAQQAEVASWMFFTANELHNGIGLARNERAFRIPSAGDYAAERGRKSLAWIEAHLADREWLELGRPTLADVSVYPFVAVAPEAGLPLDGYPAIQRWVARLGALPGFLPMPMLKAPAAA
jgi:glutathione S-transferase